MNVGSEMAARMRYFFEVEGNTPAREQPFTIGLCRDDARVEVEVVAYDSLAVALQQLKVWGDPGDASLEKLAATIGERVTYLSEPLALIERDIERRQAQLRSRPPFVRDETIEFYEGQLMGEEGGAQDTAVCFQLVRYRQPKGQRHRTRIPMTLTHEVFQHLVADLATILRSPPGVVP